MLPMSDSKAAECERVLVVKDPVSACEAIAVSYTHLTLPTNSRV